MKHIKTIAAVAIFSALSLGSVNAAKPIGQTDSVPVELSYIGSIKNQPLFQLNFSGSAAENEFSISVTDENGFVFYEGSVKGEKFSKQFLFDTENLGETTVRFAITGKKSGKNVNYTVNRQRKVLEEMNIVKL